MYSKCYAHYTPRRRELDFLIRYTTMRDEGIPRWQVTGEQLDRINTVLG